MSPRFSFNNDLTSGVNVPLRSEINGRLFESSLFLGLIALLCVIFVKGEEDDPLTH